MPELRLNLITREWVIIAKERARRPRDFKVGAIRKSLPEYLRGCPFCPGNEDKTPKEIMRLGKGKEGWQLRVVPNKFSVLEDFGEKKRMKDGIRRSVTGVGRHEVIIESPLHNLSPALMDLNHVTDIISVYKERFAVAHCDPRVEHAIIFRNYGEGAGTSLEHPHSQLIATPVVPVQFRDRIASAMHYFDDTGQCLVCDVLKMELEEGSRVVIDTEHFTTFIPYAALSPFHTWIFPKQHCASFSDINDAEEKDLAFHLKTVLAKLYHGLDNPDYNYVIRSSRPQDARNEYCHWYVSIVPRTAQVAGFELGSGMYINTSLPEDNAEFLRGVNAP